MALRLAARSPTAVALWGVPAGPLLVADIVDPGTGDIVGCHPEGMDLVRRGFVVPPGGTTPVSLLVATDSFDPVIGYAVPPGEWGIQVTLNRITEHDPELGY